MRFELNSFTGTPYLQGLATVVPEPGTLEMLILGLVVAWIMTRRRSRKIIKLVTGDDVRILIEHVECEGKVLAVSGQGATPHPHAVGKVRTPVVINVRQTKGNRVKRCMTIRRLTML